MESCDDDLGGEAPCSAHLFALDDELAEPHEPETSIDDSAVSDPPPGR